jgi:acid phosphatase family membrane protein YuiD
MDFVLDGLKTFVGNYMLMSAVIGWFSAQIIKLVTTTIIKKKFDIKIMFSNGGMPSAHSATVLALTASAAISYGLGSAAFAISGILAMIVMNDAFGVRLEAGKQAQVINKLVKEMFSNKEDFDVKLKEVLGHTPFQVLMGALLGIVVAVVYALILRATGNSPFLI